MKGKGLAFLLLIAWLTFPSGSVSSESTENRRAGCSEGRTAALTEGWMAHWSNPSPGPGQDIKKADAGIPETLQWEPYDLQQPPHPRKGQLLWLKKTLNEADVPCAALFLPQYSCFRAFQVYLDGVRIYQSGAMGPAFINRHLYIKWHLIPLPPDYFNKTVLFRFFSDHHQVIGIVSTIYLGEVSTILSRVVRQDLDLTILGFLMIIGGLFAAFFLIVCTRLKNALLLYCSITAVSGGIYILTESALTSMLFDHPVLQSTLHYVTFFVFTGGIWAFMEQTVGGGWKKFYRLNCLFQIAYLVAAMLLDLLEILSWDITFTLGMALLGVSITAAEVGLLKVAMAGNLEARVLCMGFGFLGLSGVWDILAGLQVFRPHRVVFPWGLVLLLISLAMVLILRYQAERRQVEEMIRRSEERFRNLFENAPISILEVDCIKTRPTVICANAPASVTFGLTKEEMALLPLERLFSSEAMRALYLAMDSLESTTHTTLESTCLRANKVEFPTRIGASLTQLMGLSRVVFTIEDITKEKERRSEEEAIAEERRRMAREIHDGLAQDLAVMNMKASVWHRMVDGRPEQMHAEIKLFQQLLRKNLQEVRRCIFALRPVDLEELGFFEATRRFIEEFGEQNRVQVSFEITGTEKDLPHRLEPVLFRIIQETLNNVRKHAQAKTVRVELDIAVDRGVKLSIQDDGQGFDMAHMERAFRDGHLGIKQMRERVDKQGGSLHVQSEVTQGTRIQVVLPLTV